MRIATFSISNFLGVQGATEAYYVFRYLSGRHEVPAFLPHRGPANQHGNVRFVKRWTGIPAFIGYNLAVMVYLLRGNCRDADIIYTYKGVISPILFMRFLLRKNWVCDFRASPVAQEIEFRRFRGALSLFRRGSYALASWFYRLTLHHCDLVVTLSDALRDELVQIYGVSEDKIYVLPVGVDPEFFKPRERMSPVSGSFRLIYVGAIAPQRGLGTVIEALARCKEHIPIKLIVVGHTVPAVVDGLKTLAQRLGVADLIEWKGFVPHGQIPQILDTCHVGLSPLPALRAYEVSSPAKVVEYLAMGKAVIATDILAHRTIIHHGENGLLIPPGDAQSLASAIEVLYADEALRARLISRARESVRNYDWGVLLAELERRLVALAH